MKVGGLDDEEGLKLRRQNGKDSEKKREGEARDTRCADDVVLSRQSCRELGEDLES